MRLFDRRDAADQLADLLDRERKAALHGRFDQLARLVTEKQRLIGSLATADLPRRRLEALRLQAERNDGLLKAMQDGVRSALRTIERPKTKAAEMRTYDASGQSTKIGNAAGPTVGRRA